MISPIRWQSIWLALVITTATVARAENPSAEKPSLPIAILDLERVFKSSKPFQVAMEKLRVEVSEMQQLAEVRKAEIDQQTAAQKKLPPDSKQLEESQLRVTRLAAELQLTIARNKKQLQEKEAEIYWDTYQQVEATVKQYCRQNGIRLVLRTTHTNLKSPKREEILAAVNRLVIFQDELDITETILSLLNSAKKE